jgi:conjugal transfer pilus assembly protein TraD
LLRCIIAACIRRGDCVIVLDPKGDVSLVDAMEKSCAQTPGRERDFVYFHSAFAQKSVRYDVLKNFDRITSIASRISSQIPSKNGGGDPFVNFAWRVILVYSLLLVACGDRPTIARIRSNVESGIEPLFEKALVQYFEHVRPGEWRKEVDKYIELSKDGKVPKPSKTTPDRLGGYTQYFSRFRSHRRWYELV